MDDLLQETLESYKSYIYKIPAGAIYIATSMREDRIQDALKEIRNFSEGLLWLTDANQLINKNGVEIELNINQIFEFLTEINEGLESQDYLLVADLFEYEIAPFFESNNSSIEAIQ